ncbi:MAG: hypothetical protein H7A53_04330, partial [Akkermansiaceae bacterium]|nr:hypothetical protein [Akkermansiaceae bacterium]
MNPKKIAKRTATPSGNRQRQRGSVLVLCMVLAGIGTLGVAAWVSLLQARGFEAEEHATALDRAMRQANSKALAREALYRNHVAAASGPASTTTYTLADDWGECAINTWAEPALSTVAQTRINKSGAVPFRAFTTDVTVGIDDGDFVHTYQYQLKSYNPALGGDLLVVQNQLDATGPSTAVTGTLNVAGRALFWGSSTGGGDAVSADRGLVQSPGNPGIPWTSTGGAAVFPDNFPFPTMTCGGINGSSNADLAGKANTVNNTGTPSNSLMAKAIALGATTVDASTPYVTTDGPDTIDPTTDDPALIAAINQSPPMDDASLAAFLQPYYPLSSTVLLTLINRATPVGDATLTQIFVDNTPLPLDALTLVVDGTAPLSEASRSVVTDANPIGILVPITSPSGNNVKIYLGRDSATHVVLTGHVGHLELYGQDNATDLANAATMDPLMIVLDETGAPDPGIGGIGLVDSNNRKLVVGVRNDHHNGTTFGFAGAAAFPVFRGVFDFEGVSLNVTTAA